MKPGRLYRCDLAPGILVLVLAAQRRKIPPRGWRVVASLARCDDAVSTATWRWMSSNQRQRRWCVLSWWETTRDDTWTEVER